MSSNTEDNIEMEIKLFFKPSLFGNNSFYQIKFMSQSKTMKGTLN